MRSSQFTPRQWRKLVFHVDAHSENEKPDYDEKKMFLLLNPAMARLFAVATDDFAFYLDDLRVPRNDLSCMQTKGI